MRSKKNAEICLLFGIQADDADAGLGGVLLHVVVECHGFQDDFLVDAAGVEQVEFAVLAPDCQANMGDVETCPIRRDGKDVAIVNAVEHIAAVPYPFLRYVADGGTRDALLHLGYQATLLHIDLEQGIGIWMAAHVGEAELHGDGDTAVGLNLANQSLPRCRLNPLAEVVVAAAVAVDFPIVVAQHPQPFEVVLPPLAAVARGERQGTDVLDKRGAVKALQVDGQLLVLAVHLQCLPHVGSVHQLAGVEQRQRLLTLRCFLCPEFQQFYDTEAVLTGVGGRLSLQVKSEK